MSYNVLVADSVRETIGAWGLPDDVLREVYQRLSDELGEKGLSALHRSRTPLDQLSYRFVVADPGNPNRKHFFLFQVKIGQDEISLVITDAGYSCQTTFPKPPPA